MNSLSQKNVVKNISAGLKTELAYVLSGGNEKQQQKEKERKIFGTDDQSVIINSQKC